MIGANRDGSFQSILDIFPMKNRLFCSLVTMLGILESLWIIVRGETCSECTFRKVMSSVWFRSVAKLSFFCKLTSRTTSASFPSLFVIENQFGNFLFSRDLRDVDPLSDRPSAVFVALRTDVNRVRLVFDQLHSCDLGVVFACIGPWEYRFV